MKALRVMTIILLASYLGCSKSIPDKDFQDNKDNQFKEAL